LKILFFIDSLGSGGAQRQIVAIAKEMKRRNHEVSFLVYHHENFYLEEIRILGIVYKCISSDNYLKRLLKIRRYISVNRYDVIISFLEATNFMATMSGFPFRKWKLILGERSANPNIKKSFKLIFFRWMHFFSDYVVANSYSNIEILKKVNPLLNNKNLKVIYNLVDSFYWKPSENYIPLLNGKFNIVIGASHQYLKNALGLIKAVSSLSNSERARLKIEWYGDKSPDNSFEESTNFIKQHQLENVISFYPATKNLKEKFQLADMVGLFSFYEGLPNTICEAITVGKPVIVSSVSDLPHILKGTKNILFDPMDYHSIANGLRKILTFSKEDLIELGKNNRDVISVKFNIENTIDLYESLIVN